jgi:O-antigen ligase/tetratricopeptide (TPR) repeat protein
LSRPAASPNARSAATDQARAEGAVALADGSSNRARLALAWLLSASALVLPLLAAPPLGWWFLPRFGRVSTAQQGALGFVAAIACLLAAWVLARRPPGGELAPPSPSRAPSLSVSSASGSMPALASAPKSMRRWALAGLAAWWGAGILKGRLVDGPAAPLVWRAALESLLLPALVGAWLVAARALASDRAPWRALWMANGLLVVDALLLGLFGSNAVSWLGGESVAGGSERGALVTLAGHANYLGSALALLFFLKLCAWRRGELSTAVAATLAAGDLAALFAVGSRGATLAVAGGALFCVALTLGERRFGLRRTVIGLASGAAVSLLAGLTAGLAILPRAGETGGGSGSRSLAGRLLARDPATFRLHAWLGASAMLAESPLLGVGPGQFDATLWARLANSAQRETAVAAVGVDRSPDPLASRFFLDRLRGASHQHAHNELLHAGAERGAIGALGLLLAWGAAMGACLLRRDFALAGGLAALAIDAQFGFPLHAPLSLLLATGLVALALSNDDAEPSAGAATRSLASRFAGAAALALAGLLLLWCAWNRASSIAGSRAALRDNADAPAAIAAHQRAINAWPANAEARRSLLLALLKDRRFDDARRGAEELAALTSDPLDWGWLGKARRSSGDAAGALAAFRVASILSPSRASHAVYAASAAFDLWRAEPSSKSAAADLEAALSRLRRVDFRHPLVALAEGAVAEANGAPERARAIGREGLALVAEAKPQAAATPEEIEEEALRDASLRALRDWLDGLNERLAEGESDPASQGSP